MVTRVGGLASGMDIDALVKKLMTAEKTPLNKLYQKKQTYEWQRDSYRSVNTKLKTFDSYIRDNLVLKSLNPKTVNVSNSNYVSATATSKASGTLSIEGVSQLASAARGVGSQINATGSTKLSELFSPDAVPTEIELQSIQSNGKLATTATKITIDPNSTIDQFLSKVNASNAGVSAVFENGKLSISAKNTGNVKDGAEIVTNTQGSQVFAKLGLTNLVTEEGKNAVFQVNGIATERNSNTFSLNGYNVTLKDTFNAGNTAALKYNVAFIEWKNTSSADYNTQLSNYETAKNKAISDYQTANEKFRETYEKVFGVAKLAAEDQKTYNTINNPELLNNLNTDDLASIQSSGVTDAASLKAWLADTNNPDLKTKLANVTLGQFNALKSLDDNKLAEMQSAAGATLSKENQILYEEIGDPDLIRNLTLGDLDPIRNSVVTNQQELDTWLTTQSSDLQKKLANVKFDQFNVIKSLDESKLTAMQKVAKQDVYNSIGTGFFNGLGDSEKTKLESMKSLSSEDFDKEITVLKGSSDPREKALGEKLGALNADQKATLRQLSQTDVSDFTNVATDFVDSNAKLADQNAKISTYNAAVDRQTTALDNFKTAYAQQNSLDVGSVTDAQLNGAKEINKDDIPGTTVSAVTMTASTNVDEMMDKIKEFVNTYNGLITDLTNQTKEAKYRAYTPLTDEQKEEMSENEIKLWEEKAKSGLLRGDSILRNGVSSMRGLVYETHKGVENTKYNTLYNVGITTSKTYSDGGLLEIDETKLRAAIEDDPDAVAKLFYSSDGKKDAVVNGETVDTRGYLEKLRDDSMKPIVREIEKKAGRATMTDSEYAIGKNLVDANKRIDTWKLKLENIEARYWKQFTAMETAINKANSQSSLFTQQ